MADATDIAAAISDAARTMNQRQTLAEMLQTIVPAARKSVPGFDHVGFSTVDRCGIVRTLAGAGDLVKALDDLQHGLREGPCMDALDRAQIVLAPRLRHEQRWPRYVSAAVRMGCAPSWR